MNSIPVVFGLETEYGVWSDLEGADVVEDSIAVVRAAAEPGVRLCWDYRMEDPHADVRGFRVSELRQDTDEAGYQARDEARTLSFVEIKSDLVLSNGARLYNDHAHPEYCTPECLTPGDVVLQDRAGEWILLGAIRRLSAESGREFRLYKNNTDYHGHSYGCHENYLVPREVPWERVAEVMTGFLVTRQVFAGAGKYGVETEDRFLKPGFQIAQRSDFFTELQSVDTMQRRPLINTRDEPHADPRLYRRFHVITGDANMSPFATRLKVGTAALVLEALAAAGGGWDFPRLADPLGAVRSISRDPAFRWEVGLVGGRKGTAIGVQRGYVAAVKALCDLSLPGRKQLIADWEETLDDLEVDPVRCRDRVDWVIKKCMVEEMQAADADLGGEEWARVLDLEYHRLDPAAGLYYGIESGGGIRGVPLPGAVEEAVHAPPPGTRALVRGLCVEKFGGDIRSVQWDHVTLRCGSGDFRISLLDLFRTEDIVRMVGAIRASDTVESLKQALGGMTEVRGT